MECEPEPKLEMCPCLEWKPRTFAILSHILVEQVGGRNPIKLELFASDTSICFRQKYMAVDTFSAYVVFYTFFSL